MPIITTLPFPDYLGHPAYGSSDVRAMRRGPPAMVPWGRANRAEDTDATAMGRAAHCMILTPQLFGREYVVRPAGVDFRTKDGKAWRDAQTAEIVTAEEWQQLQDIQAAFASKRAARESLAAADAIEASVFWECPESGLPCKGRPDWFTLDCVHDLKVSVVGERDLAGVTYKAFANGWMHQLAHNRGGLNANGMEITKGRLTIIAPKPPQALHVWLIEVRESDLDLLELDNQRVRMGIAGCVKAGVWPGTPEEWQVVEVPHPGEFNEVDLLGAVEVPNTDGE